MKINRTVDRAIQMLELIAKNPKGIDLNEIIQNMGIPKSSGFDILHTLVNASMVTRVNKESKMYKLGVKSFIIGNQYINNIEVVEIAKPYIQALGEKYKKSIFIAKEGNGKIIYIHKFQPVSDVVATCVVGTENEYYNTALGRCVLAYKEDRYQIIKELVRDNKIIDEEAFIQSIDLIKYNKYATSNEEHEKRIFCIAAPVFSHDNEVVVAISMSGLYSGKEICDEEIKDLKETAYSISAAIGFEGNY